MVPTQRSFQWCLAFLMFCIGVHAHAQSWQQRVDSDIRVSLDDVRHRLDGDIQLIYHNNSPDTLDFVWMHLWPNAYRNGKTAMAQQHFRDGDMFMFYAMSRDMGGIDSLAFTSMGQPLEWSYDEEHIDIAKVMLPKSLFPGEAIEISTPFRVDIPNGSISRLGHVGESYQITQWYPKPAVYDQDGWHPMPYLSQGEFYSEYGTFDVRITLPSNYTVGATGDYVEGSEDNAPSWHVWTGWWKKPRPGWRPKSWEEIEDLKGSQHLRQGSRPCTSAKTEFMILPGLPTSDSRCSEVKLPSRATAKRSQHGRCSPPKRPNCGRKHPSTSTMPRTTTSSGMGTTPTTHVTAVDGTISAGGGMEYPNVTVIGQSGSDFGLETVIVHEVGHNWFYGILGSNERDNAWMDEGHQFVQRNALPPDQIRRARRPVHHVRRQRTALGAARPRRISVQVDRRVELPLSCAFWRGPTHPVSQHGPDLHELRRHHLQEDGRCVRHAAIASGHSAFRCGHAIVFQHVEIPSPKSSRFASLHGGVHG